MSATLRRVQSFAITSFRTSLYRFLTPAEPKSNFDTEHAPVFFFPPSAGSFARMESHAMDDSASSKNAKTATPPGDTAAKRRSQRVQITMPILVRGNTGQQSFEEETKTAVVNANGCSFLLDTRVTQGQQVSLVNLKTAEELPCHVAFVGPGEADRLEVGVEFAEPSPLFWRISFPPEDWDPARRKLPTKTEKPGAERARIPWLRS